MSDEPAHTSGIDAALVSVGASPAPVLHVLRQHQPSHVWYCCSHDSRATADDIQRQLGWHPAPRFIEVRRFEELGPCYREFRRRIPEILRETRVLPPRVLVDYTGGTKTMSAALVLAATELFGQFSYVGGKQREKGGLGIVVDGEEKVLYQDNPWTGLAIREIERARDLWDAYQFDASARVLRDVAPKVPYPLRFEAVATLADALAARHRLDFHEAERRLHAAIRQLRPVFEAHPSGTPLLDAEQALAICRACAQDNASSALLGELLDNALRTAAQHRFEDAAARLYRAMEMQGQLWLADATGGLFTNGRCRPNDPGRIPECIRSLPFCQPDPDGEIRLSLEQVFIALAALGHERARGVVADLNSPAGQRTPKSRWRAATAMRNASILAHGVQPVGKDGFEKMKILATDFLGFNLACEANPIPPMDPRWLE